MARDPDNGPTFSKPTTKRKPVNRPSPDRQKAQEDEDARVAAKTRHWTTLLRTDPNAWYDENFGKKE